MLNTGPHTRGSCSVTTSSVLTHYLQANTLSKGKHTIQSKHTIQRIFISSSLNSWHGDTAGDYDKDRDHDNEWKLARFTTPESPEDDLLGLPSGWKLVCACCSPLYTIARQGNVCLLPVSSHSRFPKQRFAWFSVHLVTQASVVQIVHLQNWSPLRDALLLLFQVFGWQGRCRRAEERPQHLWYIAFSRPGDSNQPLKDDSYFIQSFQYLNIKLTDISVTDPDKYPHMLSVKNCFIRGSVVR